MIDSSKNSGSKDIRLYVPNNDGWSAEVKQNSTKEYCYYKNPGEDYFHLLVLGEVFLVRNNEKCCLSCALRHEVVTSNRLHWQHTGKTKKMNFPF